MNHSHKNCSELIILLQFMHKARVELRRLKFIVRATWAVGIIRKWFYGWKARKLYRQMRYAIKYEAAAIVIQKYYRGWKVCTYVCTYVSLQLQHYRCFNWYICMKDVQAEIIHIMIKFGRLVKLENRTGFYHLLQSYNKCRTLL